MGVGILANSSSSTMVADDAAADNTFTGYVTDEQITLTVTPTGTNYAWSMAIPSASSPLRSELSAETGASVTFTPDVAGYYTIVCIVDSTTTYVLRLSVTAITATVSSGAINFPDVTDNSVPTPTTGLTLYSSSTQGTIAVKDTGGTVSTPFIVRHTTTTSVTIPALAAGEGYLASCTVSGAALSHAAVANAIFSTNIVIGSCKVIAPNTVQVMYWSIAGSLGETVTVRVTTIG